MAKSKSLGDSRKITLANARVVKLLKAEDQKTKRSLNIEVKVDNETPLYGR